MGTGMTRVSKPLVAGAAALAGVILCADLAAAQSRSRVTIESAPPLTVQRRSFLDPGKVAPIGSRNRYVQQITQIERPVYSYIGPGGFGYETLPRRFDPPGRPQPLFEFSTGVGGP